jgi:hypothetical protein
MPVSPIKLSIGQTNIKVADQSSAANLGRELRKAFGQIEDNVVWFCGQVKHFLAEDLYYALLPTFDLSQRYCPILTGELKASGYLEVQDYRSGVRVEMGYARGGLPEYAIHVHELPAYHESPTSEKFLERALDEDWTNVNQRIVDSVRIRIGAT